MKEMSKFDQVVIFENNTFEIWQQLGKSAFLVRQGVYNDEAEFIEKMKQNGWK